MSDGAGPGGNSDSDDLALPPDLQASYDEFIREQYPRMAHIMLYGRSDRKGEDALQEALFVAYQDWKAVSTKDSPSAWVLRVARHRRYHLDNRAYEREEPTGLAVADSAFGSDTAEAVVDRAELRRALDQLPQRLREVFVICDVTGSSTAEAAVTLDITHSTVRAHLARARARLRRLLSESNTGGDCEP